MSNLQKLVASTRTINDLLPVHEHPPAGAVRGIYKVAREQMFQLKEQFKDSNEKARFIRDNLTPEQLYIYEWMNYVFTIMALQHAIFARQIGCAPGTLKSWLGKKGHFPTPTFFRRFLSIYEMNFTDQLARELLHGEQIGQWREMRQRVTRKELGEHLNRKYEEQND